MVSAVESMAANTSWSALGKATDLRNRILFTLGLLIVYRLGTFIPVPGIDGTALRQFMESAGQGIGGMVSMFTGGALGRMGIFALGIMPYISASIIVQLMTSMVPALEQLKKEGEQGRKKINQYTRFGTVALATLQAYGLAVSLEAGDIAADPGMYFRIACMITLVGGTMFLMWLGEQITARGIGNGISLIIFVGIVAELPAAAAQFLSQGRSGAISPAVIIGVLVMVMAVIAFVVFMERALRKIHIQYPRRQVGMKMYDGGSSHLPIKVNPAGVIPAIFASALLLCAGLGQWQIGIDGESGVESPYVAMTTGLIEGTVSFYTSFDYDDVALFPEAQATDGTDVVPFKSAVFEAAVLANRPVIPVSIRYHDGNRPTIAHYGNSFFAHIIRLLKNPRLQATVMVLQKIPAGPNRQTLATQSYRVIRDKVIGASKNHRLP